MCQQNLLLNTKFNLNGADLEVLWRCDRHQQSKDYQHREWRNRFTFINDGEIKKVDPYLKNRSSYHGSYDIPTYKKFVDSYAQDEIGYSDDDIDTIFDGDSSAYWNID